jgi:hypothetical protein
MRCLIEDHGSKARRRIEEEITSDVVTGEALLAFH